MRFLFKASVALASAAVLLVIVAAIGPVSSAVGLLGWGYFWAWLLVILPLTLWCWVFPFTFGMDAFNTLYQASLGTFDPNDGEWVRADGRRIATVIVMMIGFFISAQLILSIVLSWPINSYLLAVEAGDVLGVILWGLGAYLIQFLLFSIVTPLAMAIFMVIAKTIANEAASNLAIQYKGFVVGIYPFMTWVYR
jgi:hypothetical protein